jgi:four helix bundle protein
MSDDRLWEKASRFRSNVARLLRVLPRSDNGRAIGQELERSLSALGSHSRAARRARTLDERIEQLCTAQDDADDTAYWMEVISGARLMQRDLLTPLLEEATDLSATIAESRESARRRRDRRPKAAR